MAIAKGNRSDNRELGLSLTLRQEIHFCAAEFGQALADLSSQSLHPGLSDDKKCSINLGWTKLHGIIELPQPPLQKRPNSL